MSSKANTLYRSVTTAILAALIVCSVPSPTKAVTAADWNAGYIINDSLFTDGDGMSVAQIQAFLVKLLPSCDIWGQQPSELGGGSRAQYGASVGNPAPFTCITNYYEVPKTSPSPAIPINNYGQYNANGTPYIPPGSKSTAQLIYDAAQQYNINPKALIIKLSTESDGPLTSDVWPLKKQFYYAMGAHCPDSGPGGAANCDINYAGFSIQIAESARLLRSYLDGMEQSWWPYKRVGAGVDRSISGVGICTGRNGVENSNCIGWNVAPRGCGGTVVHIQTKATAALYTYTPYQPNAAALNNMYGTGDYCSAYGNRNFWRVWNDWFGSTREAGYTPFFQLPGSVQTYVMGAGNTYYKISDYQKLKDYGFEGPFKLRIKQLEQSALAGYTFKGELPRIARFEGIGVFLAIDGKIRPFPSEEILNNYGFQIGQEATLPKEMADIILQGDPLWDVAATAEGGATYLMSNGKKQAMCSWDVYTKLGSPLYSTRPKATLPSRFLSTIANGAPIAMDGDVFESTEKTIYGVWSNSSFIPMDGEIAKKSGTINCGVPADAINQLPKMSATINNLVAAPDGKQYIIENKKKLLVNQIGTATLATPTNQFIPVTDKFLTRLSNDKLTPLVRVDQSPAVHLIHNSKTFGIPTEADLFGLGYSFNDVKSVTQKTYQTLQSGGLAFRPKALVRESSSPEVYLIDANFKRHYISSEAILYAYGFTWNDIRVVPNGSLNDYEKETPLRFYIKENDSLYWLMDRGLKRRIPMELVGQSYYNVTSDKYTVLSVPVLSQYPMTTELSKVFRAGSDPGVFIIESGLKRAFTNETAFFNRGFNWNSVRSLDPKYVSNLPSGAHISQ